MAQRLKALPVLPDGLGLVPSAQNRKLSTACSLCHGTQCPLLTSPGSLAEGKYSHKHTHKSKKKNLTENRKFWGGNRQVTDFELSGLFINI